MKTSIVLKPLFLIAGVSLLASGCIYRQTVYSPGPPPPSGAAVETGPASAEVVVPAAPPAPIVETLTIAPAPDFVWVGGVWAWHGRWVWEPGHWAHPPHPHAMWVGGRYEFRGGRHVWVRGYWR